jgi:hypothetical protein
MRVALFRELRVPNIYTIEASFCGARDGKYAGKHFTTGILKEMGRDLCLALIMNVNTELPK